MARTIRPAPSSSADRMRIGEQVMNVKQDRVAVRASVLAVRVRTLRHGRRAPAAYAADPAPARSGSRRTDAADQLRRGRRRLRQPGLVQVRPVQRPLQARGRTASSTSTSADEAPYDATAPCAGASSAPTSVSTRAARYAEGGEQGTFRVFVGFDELRSNYTDTYQTPYLGAGTNTLTLPSNWLKPVVPQVERDGGNFRALSPTARARRPRSSAAS